MLRLAPLVLLALAAPRAAAQPLAWTLVADGAPDASWRPSAAWTADSLRPAVRAALAHLRGRGHAAARLDSAAVGPDSAFVYATAGPLVGLARVSFEGRERLSEPTARAALALPVGAVVSDTTLDAALGRLAAAYAAAGMPLARVRVAALDTAAGGFALTLAVDEGADAVLDRVELPAEARTQRRLAARIAGLEPGRRLRRFDADEAARRLRATGYFRRVGTPRLERDSTGALVAVLPVEEVAPGAFDLVFGLLPPTQAGQKAQLAGSGSLTLRNLAGLGYDLAVRLNRLPGRVANASARAASPYLLGLPLRLDVRFDGLQQDSTLAQQRYRAEAAYRIGPLDLVALVSSERTQPGDAGKEVVGLVQRVARTDALFSGAGLRYVTTDHPENPRRGVAADALAEVGVARRSRLERPAPAAAPATVRTSSRHERLTARLRAYVPTLRRQVLVVGADAWLLRAPSADEADLFRIGGAATLRGYDEEQFRAQTAARGVAEYRYQLDARSYAFAFADAGYVDQPAVGGRDALRAFRPGYGLGVQLDTPAGLVLATYAASPDTGLGAGRLHVGLSFGL